MPPILRRATGPAAGSRAWPADSGRVPDGSLAVMATIHQTTMNPGKLDLLAGWLPTQPWYLGAGHEPKLSRAGGFRLDDPAGAVGIEFMVVADDATGDIVSYLVPMTYRGQPLASADHALIGTSEHGVLGRRWIYDGVHDPVLIAQLVACVQGAATPQAQGQSDTPDPTVITAPLPDGGLAPAGSAVVVNSSSGTDLRVKTGGPAGQLLLHLHRVLDPEGAGAGQARQPCVSATWRLGDGTGARGVFVSGASSQRQD